MTNAPVIRNVANATIQKMNTDGPGELHAGRVVDEQHDRDEDHDEVERPERPRDEDRRDLLGDHLLVGLLQPYTLPPLKEGRPDPSEERSHPVIAGGNPCTSPVTLSS